MDIWNSKGLSFNALGQYNEAIECFDTAIKLNPNHTEALNNNNKDIAISNLTKQQQQEQQQQTQIKSSSSTNIGNTIAVGTRDPETVTKEIVVEEHNKCTSEPIIERDTSSSSQPKEYASCPVKKEEHQEKSYATVNKYPQQKNLKLLIPIIIVAVVIGSVIAFAVFSITITTTPAKIFSNMTEITETTYYSTTMNS